jgi:parvulin-like peptidyl-prolyl isomerase
MNVDQGAVKVPSGAAAINTMRAMILCASGALIGLGIAGYGLFTASGTSTKRVPPENIAMVNQRPVLRSDFVTQLESETGKRFEATSRAEQLKVLDEMVREELLVQRALELDFAETDQNARNALVTTVTDQAIAEVTTSEVSEDQLREYYRQHPGQWATEGIMTLRQFLLRGATGQTEGQLLLGARKAAEELRATASFDQTAARLGLTEGARQDNEYYFAVKYRLGDALFDAIRGLTDGQVSDVVIAKDGAHLVYMIKNQKPEPLTFEVARSQVLQDYTEATQSRIMESTMSFLRSRAKILIAIDYAGAYKAGAYKP